MVMTLADPDAQKNALEAEDVPDPHFGDECTPDEAEHYNWDWDEPLPMDFLEEDLPEEDPHDPPEDPRIHPDSHVIIHLRDVRVTVEELDEYEEEEEEDEHEEETPRAVLLAAWWEYKRQNGHRRRKKKIITLHRIEDSDRYADEEELDCGEPC